jgi:glycosyltransferase involved in cell wall biosynthesis
MSAALHVAYVCADRGVPIGGTKGASAHVRELTRALAAHGVAVRILATRVANPGRALPPVVAFGAGHAARTLRAAAYGGASRPTDDARASEAYSLLLNYLLGQALERLHRQWRIDAVYERYSLWSYAGAAFARAHHLPYLLEVNAPLRDEQRRYRRLENAAAAAGLESFLFRSADHVLVPSQALRPYVIAHGARAGGVRVVPNAADPDRFAVRKRPAATDAFVVGFLGTLKPWHGVEDLLRAFRHLQRRDDGYRLLIAGDGPLRAPLERMSRRLGCARAVTFAGEIVPEDVPHVLAQLDVAVAPYPQLAHFYFSPLKVFEYLAAGVPVVASDIGQLGEVLTHRRTALLYRPGAVRELVAHVERLRADPRLARRLAGAGRRLVRRRFTWARNAERVVALIERQRRRARGGDA